MFSFPPFIQLPYCMKKKQTEKNMCFPQLHILRLNLVSFGHATHYRLFFCF